MISRKEEKHLDEFYIAGIAVRTTNADGQAIKDIGALWHRFMADGLLMEIKNRLSDEIYNVYTNYETDHNGYYTAVLGCRVSSLNDLDERFYDVTVLSGQYLVHNISGKIPESVGDAWQEIWNSDLERTYTADFDLYSTSSTGETTVSVYVAVK